MPKQVPTRREVCGACTGAGIVLLPGKRDDEGNFPTAKCDACNGAGFTIVPA